MNAGQFLTHFERISEAPDAIARLRRFILDLAVRGKLVEQDPRDEPASELLKRIRAEKARLVKAGQIRESKPLVAIKTNETSYEIPANWKWVALGETVNNHLGGGTPSKSNSAYWDGNIYWASVKDVGKNKYVDATIDRITDAGLADSSSNLIPPGNLIVVTRMGLGKVSINRVPIAINQDLRALSLSSLSVIEYYYIFFKTHGFVGTGLTVKGIKVEELLSIAFPLPPLAEQNRIVAKVDELMALCDRLEAAQAERESRRDRVVAASLNRLNNGADAESFREHTRFHLRHLPCLTTRPEHIQQLRQTIHNLAVRGRLVLQDPDDESGLELLKRIQSVKVRLVKEGKINKERPFPVIAEKDMLGQLPNGWEWVRMQDVFDVRDGTHDTPKYIEADGVPLITSRNFVDGRISFERAKLISWDDHNLIKKRSGVDQGDILYSMIGGNIGNQVMVETDREFSIKNVALFKYYSKSDTVPAYLHLFLKTVAIGLQGQAAGGAQPFVSLKQLRSIPFPLPPVSEQHRIVAKVDELTAMCDQLETQLHTTEADSRGLLEASLFEALAA